MEYATVSSHQLFCNCTASLFLRLNTCVPPRCITPFTDSALWCMSCDGVHPSSGIWVGPPRGSNGMLDVLSTTPVHPLEVTVSSMLAFVMKKKLRSFDHGLGSTDPADHVDPTFTEVTQADMWLER